MNDYQNSDILQVSVFENKNKKYTYAQLKDLRFAIVKKRLLSFFFKNKYVLVLDGYVSLPFIYDEKRQVKIALSEFN